MNVQDYSFVITIGLVVLALWLKAEIRKRSTYSTALFRIQQIQEQAAKLKQPVNSEILAITRAALWCCCEPNDKKFRDLMRKKIESQSWEGY